jgi:hypothetical protein
MGRTHPAAGMCDGCGLLGGISDEDALKNTFNLRRDVFPKFTAMCDDLG